MARGRGGVYQHIEPAEGVGRRPDHLVHRGGVSDVALRSRARAGFLAGEGSRFITVQLIAVDGGLVMLGG